MAFPWTAVATFGDRKVPSRVAASPVERGSRALSLLCPAHSLNGYLGVKIPDQRNNLSCLLLGRRWVGGCCGLWPASPSGQ